MAVFDAAADPSVGDTDGVGPTAGDDKTSVEWLWLPGMAIDAEAVVLGVVVTKNR